MDDNEVYDRLGHLEAQNKILDNRLGSLEVSMASINTKIDRLGDRLGTHKTFDPAAILSFIRDSAVLIGMACTAIIYFASQPGASDLAGRERMAVMEYKMSVIEKHIGWKATVVEP